MGAGDVKLAALLGAMLGFPQIIVGLLLGFASGGVLSIVLLGLKLRRRNDTIPFGPELVGSAAVILLTGTSIFDWYWAWLR
jgi:leader peptidase (prepilin peptidase)/N-methyltransferase